MTRELKELHAQILLTVYRQRFLDVKQHNYESVYYEYDFRDFCCTSVSVSVREAK